MVPVTNYKVKYIILNKNKIFVSDKSGDAVQTTFSGLICLAGYMAFDSFTSNWQSEVFKYKMSSMEMMFGVNVFSCLFTSWSLIQQGFGNISMNRVIFLFIRNIINCIGIRIQPSRFYVACFYSIGCIMLWPGNLSLISYPL